MSVRQHEDILSVWTQDSKDDDAIAKIRDAIKGNLDLPPFVTIDYKRISASRGAAAPSRHRRDSCPPDEVVGGFFFNLESIWTRSRRRTPARHVMKNWLPFVSGPLFAMLNNPGPECLRLKFSSANDSP